MWRAEARVTAAIRLAWMLAAGATVFPVVGCGDRAAADGDRLPGRIRPLLRHDWPHPRDFTFDRVRFMPPDPAAVTFTTVSRLRAYVIGVPEDRTVRITAALPLGRAFERDGEIGASDFIVQGLRRARPAERSAALGTGVQVEERPDVTLLSVEVLPDDWRPALEIVVQRVRRYAPDTAALTTYRTGPGYFAQTARVDDGGVFRPRVELERLLGGYPLAPADPRTTVRLDAVRALTARALTANAVVVGVGGRIDADAVRSALQELSAGWGSGTDVPVPAAVRAAAPPVARFHRIDAPTLEGWVAIGRVIEPVPEAQRAVLAVLGDVFNTRLNIAAREMRGLANRTIFELPESLARGGLMRILTGGRHEAVAPLVTVCLDEARRIHASDDTVSAEEVDRSKGALVFSVWQGSLDGAGQASATYAARTVQSGSVEEWLARPAQIQAVTAEQVKAAAAKYLDPRTFTTVVVGPLAAIAQARHFRWPATLDEIAERVKAER